MKSRVLKFSQVAENAFRVLGLSSLATAAEVHASAASMRNRLKLQARIVAPVDLNWIDECLRTQGTLQRALGQLIISEQRLVARLFWFGAGAQITTSIDLRRPPPIAAFGSNPEARHDYALFLLLRAGVVDPEFKNDACWSQAIDAWQSATDDEHYWDWSLELDRSGGFEPTADAGDVAAVRREATRLALITLTDKVRASPVERNVGLSKRVIRVLRNASLSERLAFALESEISGPIEDHVATLCRDIEESSRLKLVREPASAATNRALCTQSTRRLDREALPKVSLLKGLCGIDGAAVVRATRQVAETYAIVAADWTWAESYNNSAKLYRRARKLASGTALAERVEQQLQSLAPMVRRETERVRPAQFAPPLFTLNGFGVKLYTFGRRYPGTDMRYGTLYFVAAFIPIVPLARYLVTRAIGDTKFWGFGFTTPGWHVHAEVRFGFAQWIHLCFVLFVFLRAIW